MVDYKTILKKIENQENKIVNSISIDMYAEYGEFNHYICSEIVKILKEWDYVYDKDIRDKNYEPPKVDEDKLRYYGKKIMDRGGLQALSMNYYTMLHYLAEDMPTKRKVQQLQRIFNELEGGGDIWRN
jgi:hypothetical protein